MSRVAPFEVWPISAWLVVAIMLPAGVFLVYSFWVTDLFGVHQVWTTAQYQTALGNAFYRGVLLTTIGWAAAIAIICVAIAYGTAYALTFSLGRRGPWVLLLIVGTALASYLVRIYAWLVILGPKGPINRGVALLGLSSKPLSFLLYTRFAVVVTLVCVLLPFALLPIYAAMQSVDRDTLRASRDLGAGPIVSFLRVVFPLTWSGVVVALLLTFILAVGDYVTPELVGGTGGIMIGRVIYDQFQVRNWALAAALAFSLIVSVAAILLILRFARQIAHSGRSPLRPRTRSRRLLPDAVSHVLWRVPWARCYLALVAAFVLGPVVLVVLFSFSRGAFAAFPIPGLSLHWYRAAFGSSDFISALKTSLRVALIATAIAISIGVPAAFGLVRRRFRLRPALTSVTLLPLALPGIVLGMGLLIGVTYAGLTPSSWTAVVAQATLAAPLVVLVVASRLRGFDSSLEEAGRDLGCSHLGVLRRVTLPIIAPTVLAVALLVFATSMDEFVVTNFVIGGDQTLPVLVWALFQRQGISPVVNAIATMLLAGTILALSAIVVLTRLRRRSGPGIDVVAAGGLADA